MSGSRAMAAVHLAPRRVVVFLIELYRTWVSPMRLPSCRFEPTCSGYAVEALTRHGFFYGGLLAIVRLLKCGPWHKPGYDPVPERGLRALLTGRAVRGHDVENYDDVENDDALAVGDVAADPAADIDQPTDTQDLTNHDRIDRSLTEVRGN